LYEKYGKRFMTGWNGFFSGFTQKKTFGRPGPVRLPKWTDLLKPAGKALFGRVAASFPRNKSVMKP
jgi:hypothetical protein